MTKVTLESLQQGIDDVLDVVKDLAQFMSERFEQLDGRIDGLDGRIDSLDGRIDGLDGRIDGLEGKIDNLERHAASVDNTLRDHTARFVQIQSTLDEIVAKQDAQHNDIAEIYSILQKHEKNQEITAAELKDTELRLQRVVAWAKDASTVLNIPIKL